MARRAAPFLFFYPGQVPQRSCQGPRIFRSSLPRPGAGTGGERAQDRETRGARRDTERSAHGPSGARPTIRLPRATGTAEPPKADGGVSGG